jgi:hypothetical protein
MRACGATAGFSPRTPPGIRWSRPPRPQPTPQRNHRFLYFIDAADGRGKVLYLRHDGDYGLVEPG